MRQQAYVHQVYGMYNGIGARAGEASFYNPIVRELFENPARGMVPTECVLFTGDKYVGMTPSPL